MSDYDLIQAIHQLEVNLTNKITTHTAKLDEHCERLDVLFEKLENTERTLYGKGNGDGLATRVKLLESDSQGRKKVTYTLFGIALPTFLNWVYELLMKG